jgi:hypothetical protein
MYTVITPERIELPPGTVVRMLGSWQEYQVLSQQLADRCSPRIKYRSGEILLMAPLPEHGRDGISLRFCWIIWSKDTTHLPPSP